MSLICKFNQYPSLASPISTATRISIYIHVYVYHFHEPSPSAPRPPPDSPLALAHPFAYSRGVHTKPSACHRLGTTKQQSASSRFPFSFHFSLSAFLLSHSSIFDLLPFHIHGHKQRRRPLHSPFISFGPYRHIAIIFTSHVPSPRYIFTTSNRSRTPPIPNFPIDHSPSPR